MSYPIFRLEDDYMIHLLNDMADFDYHQYCGPPLQNWSYQDLSEISCPDFSDQPFDYLDGEEDILETFIDRIKKKVNKYVALTEEEISYEVERQLKLEEEEVFKTIDLSSSIVPSCTHPRDPSPPPTLISKNFVLQEPTPMVYSHADYCLEGVVEVTCLHRINIARLEGSWDQDPYVVSYDI